MTEENRLLEVDYSKVNYRIGIDANENGSTFYVYDVRPGYEIRYHELIGIVEALKIQLIQNHIKDLDISLTYLTFESYKQSLTNKETGE